MIRRQRDILIDRPDRFISVTLAFVNRCELLVRFRLQWIEFDDLLQVLDRLFRIAPVSVEITQLKIRQIEFVLHFSKLTYGKFFSGTILELMHENQIRIFEIQLDFLIKLQAELDKKSVKELFKIDEFEIDKIMAKVKDLTQQGD